MKTRYTYAACCDGGRRPARRSEIAKNEGYYFKSHGLRALAMERSETCAKRLHRRIAEDWGFPDPPYGASVHFALLRQALQLWLPRVPESRGSSRNPEIIEAGRDWRAAADGMMMDPEASVNALVFQQPDCMYFSVGDAADN